MKWVWPTTVCLPAPIPVPFPDEQPILIAAHPHGICSSACAAFGSIGPDPRHHWLAQLVNDPYRGRAAVTHWLMSVPLLCNLCQGLGMFPVSRESLKRALFHHRPAARHSVLLHPGGVEEFMGESEQKERGPYVECRKHLGFLRILWKKRHAPHPVPLFPVYYRGEHRRSKLSMPWPWLSRKCKPWLWGLPVGCFWRPRWGFHPTIVEVYGPLWARDFATLEAFCTAYQETIEGACQREIADALHPAAHVKSA